MEILNGIVPNFFWVIMEHLLSREMLRLFAREIFLEQIDFVVLEVFGLAAGVNTKLFITTQASELMFVGCSSDQSWKRENLENKFEINWLEKRADQS